jgi:hypothetical protein
MNSKTLIDVNNSFTNLINSNNNLINISDELKKFNGNLSSEVDILKNKTTILNEKYNTYKQNYPISCYESLYDTITTNNNIAVETIKLGINTLGNVDTHIDMINTAINEFRPKIPTLANNYDEVCFCFDSMQLSCSSMEYLIIDNNIIDKTYDLLIIIIDLNKKMDDLLESME